MIYQKKKIPTFYIVVFLFFTFCYFFFSSLNRDIDDQNKILQKEREIKENFWNTQRNKFNFIRMSDEYFKNSTQRSHFVIGAFLLSHQIKQYEKLKRSLENEKEKSRNFLKTKDHRNIPPKTLGKMYVLAQNHKKRLDETIGLVQNRITGLQILLFEEFQKVNTSIDPVAFIWIFSFFIFILFIIKFNNIMKLNFKIKKIKRDLKCNIHALRKKTEIEANIESIKLFKNMKYKLGNAKFINEAEKFKREAFRQIFKAKMSEIDDILEKQESLTKKITGTIKKTRKLKNDEKIKLLDKLQREFL